MSDITTVLLVTADEMRRLHVARMLRRVGFRVDLAGSAREALHALAAPGAVGATGLGLLLVDQESLGPGAEQVIQAAHNAELVAPMLVLSSLGGADDTIGCLRAGAVDYILLPAAVDEFLDTVYRALSVNMVR